MTDLTLGRGPLAPQTPDIRDTYLAEVRRKRMYGGIRVTFSVLLTAAGWVTADERNAGGFWEGLHQVFDFPAEVVSEAWANRANLPGLFVEFLPSLIETINIAAMSTLLGALAAMVLALMATRGLARFPRLIPIFRRRWTGCARSPKS